MKREHKIIIALAVVLFIACTTIACLVGWIAGRGWPGFAHRWQSLAPIEPTVVPQPRLGPRWVGVAALVTEVVEDSPAAGAGIQPGDLILAIDGRQIQRDTDLRQVLASFEPGDRVELTVRSLGRTREVQVRLGRHPDDSTQPYLGIAYQLVPDSLD
jgi:membrane-associated protease RseP (regulator of RpoE activity)